MAISCNHGYCEYFQPEIKPFLTKENIKKYFKTSEDDEFIENLKKEVDDDFFTKRKEGENDHCSCKLIRFNQIVEFITFAEKTNLPLDIYINYSIFETNRFSYSIRQICHFICMNQLCKHPFFAQNNCSLLDLLKY